MNRRLYVFAYDIGDNKRRSRVRRLLRAYAVGGQKSLFECLLSVSERESLCNELKAVLDKGDKVVVALLPDNGEYLPFGRAKPLVSELFLMV